MVRDVELVQVISPEHLCTGDFVFFKDFEKGLQGFGASVFKDAGGFASDRRVNIGGCLPLNAGFLVAHFLAEMLQPIVGVNQSWREPLQPENEWMTLIFVFAGELPESGTPE